MRSAKGIQYNHFDVVRLAPRQSDKPERPKNEELIRKINADKDVCLTCTKEKCNGGEYCFRKRKSQIKK